MINAYTDGSCLKNPGKGGWAALIEREVEGSIVQSITIKGSEQETTNNRMEMTAAIKVLEALPEGSEVTIFSDSKYLVNGMICWLDKWIQQGREIANLDLWSRLKQLSKVRSVHWQWIKGHAGSFKNTLVDALAQQAARQGPTMKNNGTGMFRAPKIKEKRILKRLEEEVTEETNVINFPVTKPDQYEPQEGDWLGKLPLHMVFLARQRNYAGYELTKFVKADMTSKGNVMLLVNNGGQAIPLDVSSARFSTKWECIEELGVIENENKPDRTD